MRSSPCHTDIVIGFIIIIITKPQLQFYNRFFMTSLFRVMTCDSLPFGWLKFVFVRRSTPFAPLLN